MAIALMVPIGHGHYYAPEHYIDAWVAVTDPTGWGPEEIARLKANSRGAGRRSERRGGAGCGGCCSPPGRRRRLRAGGVAGNVLTRYRGWSVERLEPDALSALLAPAYRVREARGRGAVSDRAPLLGLRRAARQRRALGGAAEPRGLGGGGGGQPRAARARRARGLAAGLRRAGPHGLGAGGRRAHRHRRRAADAVRGPGEDRADRGLARGMGDHGPPGDGSAGAAALQPRAGCGRTRRRIRWRAWWG